MRPKVRLLGLLLILACAAGYYYVKQPGRNPLAAANHHQPQRVPTTEEEKLARSLVEKKDFAAVDTALDQFRKDDARTSGGVSRLNMLYEAIEQELNDLEKYKHLEAVTGLLDSWKKAKPDSQGRRVCTALFYIDAAWRARGADVAVKVRQDQWKTFENLLTKAFEQLNEARHAEPYDPQVAACMFTIGMAAGMPKESAQELIDEVIEKYPTYEEAYRRMATYLLPRWAGEPGDLEAFMADVRKRLPQPQGDIIYAQVTQSVYGYVGRKFLVETGLKYKDIKSAYETMIQHYPDYEPYRRAFSVIAAIADDKEKTRDLLEQTTGTWTAERIRANYGSEDTFAMVQGWVNGSSENPLHISPLEIAFELRNAGIIKAAIAEGADPNGHFSNGSTPLIEALSHKQADLAKYLMEKGASTTVTARNGYTVAAAAIEGDNLEMLKTFLDKGLKVTDEVNGAHYTMMHVAAYYNSEECMKAILNLPGANVNAKLPNGQTPLFMAAMNDAVDCAKLLLDAGADVNAKQTNLITPVHQAAYSGSPKTLKLILERGGDPEAKSDCDVKPIDEARRNHQEETERILADAIKKS